MKLTREQYRYFLKDSVRLAIDFSDTDQSRGKPAPPIQKPVPAGAKRVALVPIHDWKGVGNVDLTTAMAERQSIRRFTSDPLTPDELSYLLWATQGIREKASPSTAFRIVPSAGCRHSFETYVCAMNIAGLEPGIQQEKACWSSDILKRKEDLPLPDGLAHLQHGGALWKPYGRTRTSRPRWLLRQCWSMSRSTLWAHSFSQDMEAS
jgi:hypothetical protein